MKFDIGKFIILVVGLLGVYALTSLAIGYIENILLMETGGLILGSIILTSTVTMLLVIMLIREEEVYVARKNSENVRVLKNIPLFKRVVAVRIVSGTIAGVKLRTGEYLDVLEVIDQIRDGKIFITKAQNGDMSKIEIYKNYHIRSKADNQKPDNLLNLPRI